MAAPDLGEVTTDASSDGLIQPVLTGAIRLEASSACQLRCPSCPTTMGLTEAVVGKASLRLADFVTLVDDNPWVGQVELSNYGEAFLNPELLDIFRHAFARNVTLTLANGVNLNHVREDVLEGLVRWQVAAMTCSIDGASQETYARYRVRGNFDHVIAHVRRINAFKKVYGSQRPALLWQFVAFGHNEHEVERARDLAKELGMGFSVKLSWDPEFSPVKNEDLIRHVTGTGAATRQEYLEKSGRAYLESICDQLWSAPQVNWDGKLLGCCRNFWGDFGGNALRDGLIPSLNHDKMVYARQMLEGRQPPRDDIPCTTCEVYTARRTAGRWRQPRPAVAMSD
jgi:MoaA/NifB/PqqE/SkfB family radical SAM enzyme